LIAKDDGKLLAFYFALSQLDTEHQRFYTSDHPHLAPLAPYEEYERHFFPMEIAERSAEMKLYLSELLDRLGLPAAAMSAFSEPVAQMVFRSVHMSDDHDWASVLAAFRSVDEKTIDAVWEAWK
jgi:hypothetical protein